MQTLQKEKKDNTDPVNNMNQNYCIALNNLNFEGPTCPQTKVPSGSKHTSQPLVPKC